MRRWKRRGIALSSVVEFNGQPVRSVRKTFARAVQDAGLEGKVTPRTLRHTAITWALQGRRPRTGASGWEASDYFGVSAEVIERTYGHHCSSRHAAVAQLSPAAWLLERWAALGPGLIFSGLSAAKLLRNLVGVRGFEPPTPSSRTRCATRLRYTPTSRRSRPASRPYSGARGAAQASLQSPPGELPCPWQNNGGALPPRAIEG
jgi:hypothetical protein